MESTNTQTAPSTSRQRYEVFLCFRGADTRFGFTDHLHVDLKKKGITVFRDDEELKRGKEIHQGLKDAIENSQYAVVVISEKFGESQSCLFELTMIMERSRRQLLTVFPVFYHVNPSDVRKQAGSFGKAFTKVENDLKVGTSKGWKAILNKIGEYFVDSSKVNEDPLKLCRSALQEVANLSGWHVEDRPESKIVDEISLKIFGELLRNLQGISKDLIGIETPAMEILKLLKLEVDDTEGDKVRVIGIHGMGGVGKTTLAQVIFAKVSSQFDAHCFLSRIAETEKNNGIVNLQREIISNILSPEVAGSVNGDLEVVKVLQSRLRKIKVFIVLDEVNHRNQVEALAGDRAWFGRGSRVILTSRDRGLLDLFDADIYTVEELKSDHALQLFSYKAFKKPQPPGEPFEKLSMTFLEFAKGLPLALEVFGTFLYRKSVRRWEYYQDKIKEKLDEGILNRLKISLEGLDIGQLKSFLIIARYLNGASKDHVISELEDRGFHPRVDLEVLEEKSLLKIENGKVLMHDLLAQMGQNLPDVECQEPGGRELLRHPNDICHPQVDPEVLEDKAVLNVENEELPKYSFAALRAVSLRCAENLTETPNSEGPRNLKIIPCRWLRVLNLSFVEVGSSAESLVNCLSCLSSLRRLYLSFCHLSDEAFLSNPSGLCSLESLSLEGNNFPRIPDGVWQLSSLKVLSLSGCIREPDLHDRTQPHCGGFHSQI